MYNDNHSHLHSLVNLFMNTLNMIQASAVKHHQPIHSDISTLIDSDQLFRNGDIVFILHKGEQYSLRRTRNGKLILNK